MFSKKETQTLDIFRTHDENSMFMKLELGFRLGRQTLITDVNFTC